MERSPPAHPSHHHPKRHGQRDADRDAAQDRGGLVIFGGVEGGEMQRAHAAMPAGWSEQNCAAFRLRVTP